MEDKKMTTENRKFNITELIESYYEQKIPLPEIFKELNYSEFISKTAYFKYEGHREKYEIKETLAENIIKELPFEAYKSCFNLNWLNKTKGNSSVYVNSAIHLKRFEFIDNLINEISKLNDKGENDPNSDFRFYAINALHPIRDCYINPNINFSKYNEKEAETLYSLWKKSLDLLSNIQSKLWMNSKNKKTNNILEQYLYTKDHTEEPIFELMTGLNEPVNFKGFKEIFSLLSEKDKQHLFITGQRSLSESSLYNINKKCIEFLQKEKLIKPKHYENVIVNKYNITYENENKVKAKDIWLYKKAKENITPEDKIKINAYDLMGLVKRFENNEIILNEILQDYPQIGENSLFVNTDMSLADINFSLKIAESFDISRRNILSTFDIKEKNTIEMIPLLLANLPQNKEVSIAKIMDSQLTKKIISILSLEKDITNEEASTLFFKRGIDLNLITQAKNIKKIKI